jgi:hypothetical protein
MCSDTKTKFLQGKILGELGFEEWEWRAKEIESSATMMTGCEGSPISSLLQCSRAQQLLRRQGFCGPFLQRST